MQRSLSNTAQQTSQQARATILQRLREKNGMRDEVQPQNHMSDFTLYETKVWSQSEKLSKFIQHLTAAHAEIHSVEQLEQSGQLTHQLNTDSTLSLKAKIETILAEKAVKNVLISERMNGINLQQDLGYHYFDYSKSIDDLEWQRTLFESIDASITTSVCAVAETGSIILVPDQIEPRLMSLVPPIHIVIVEKNKIYNTLFEAIQHEQWHFSSMPTNLIMISGPSKTADIEQTLAYGVHGPKELIVVLV